MCVLDRRAGSRPDIFEEHAIDEAAILLQVHQAVAIGPKDLADILLAQVGQGHFMKRTLDDHLMGADAVHFVVDALAALVEVAFDLQGRKFIGNHADAPALFVGPRRAVAVGNDLVRRLVLLAFAEGTVSRA